MRADNLSEIRSSLRFADLFALMMVMIEILALFLGATLLAAFQAVIVAWATIGTIAIHREYRQNLRAEMIRLSAEYERLCREELIQQIESLA